MLAMLPETAAHLASIAVCLVTLPTPERQPLLHEAIDSVYAQTRQPDDVVIGLDYSRLGEVANMNRVIHATTAEWLAFLHDDDIWAPDHLETCEQYFDTADVVVSRFYMEGRPWNTMEPWHDDFQDLRYTNWIGSPSMVVVRREIFGEWVGVRPGFRWNDWSQWNLLLDRGARFVDTKQRTVTYRFGAWSNGSWAHSLS